MLLSLISTIRNSLHEIIAMTSHQSNKKMSEFHPFLSPQATKQKNRAESESTIAERCGTRTISSISNKSMPSVCEVARNSTQHAQSTGTAVVSSSPKHNIMDKLRPAVEGAILYFCEVTLYVVYKMILHSHGKLSSSLRSASSECQSRRNKQGRGGTQVRKESRVVSFDVPDLPEKVDSLAELLRHDLDSETMQAKLNNLISSSSVR